MTVILRLNKHGLLPMTRVRDQSPLVCALIEAKGMIKFMKLYVARHGQTIWNAQNKVCGITDVELTEKGIE